MVDGCNDCFWGLRVKLISWYSILIFSDFDPEIKMYAWSSTVGHLTGDHSQCLDHKPTSFVWQIGVDNPEAALKLQEILDKRVNDLKETIMLEQFYIILVVNCFLGEH